MKQFWLLLHIILFAINNFFSQGLINTSVNLYLTSNSNVILSGNANWIQNGTVTCANGSNVKFTGNTYQYIRGTNITNFSNVFVNNTGGGVVAGKNFSISGTLTLINGHFDLKQYIIDLGTTGIVSGENENARIRATSGALGGGVEGGNTGIIRATRNNPSGDVAGLGLNFTPSIALGDNTIIERGCNPLQGSGSFSSNYSIFRWYRITPGNGIVNPISVNNFYYWGGNFDTELNGHIESQLQMFQQVQYWNGTTNPVYWEPRSTIINTTNDFIISSTTSNLIMLNYILITLASSSQPLPVEYINFKGYCKQNYILLTWQTASENNNYGFKIQKSYDKSKLENIGFVAGQGYSNTITSYQFIDSDVKYSTSYYLLEQIDYDGNAKVLNEAIAVDCSTSHNNDDIMIFSNNDLINIIIKGNPGTTYHVYFTNILGQIVYQTKISLESSPQCYSIKNNFASGIYHVNMIGINKRIIKDLFILKY